MFKPTHTYHYPEGSNNKRTWPNGVPVIFGFLIEDGLTEWLADDEGNVAGYSTEGDTHVVPLNQVNVDTVVVDLKALMEMERENLSVSPNSEYFEGKIQAIKEFIEYLTGEVYE